MPVYLTPGVYYEAVDQNDQRPVALRTDVAGFVGVAAMGPLDTPVRLSSWRQFESSFGGLWSNAFLGYAVRAFFENGGTDCYVVRVAAPPAETAPTVGAVQPADGLSSLVEVAGGFIPGAVATVVQEDMPFGQTLGLTAVDTVARRLTWDSPLAAGFWLGEPIRFEQAGGAVSWSAEGVTQPFDRLSSIVRSVAGFEVGRSVTVRQPLRLRREGRRISSIGAGGAELHWERTLTPPFDVAGPLRFEAGAGTATALFLNTAGETVIQVSAASPGAWGNALRVRLAVTAGAVTTATGAVQPPDRLSSRVADVTGFRRGDLVRIFQAGPAPAVVYAILADVDAVHRSLNWQRPAPDPDLSLAEPLPAALDIQRPLSFERIDFALNVYVQNGLREVIPGLSLVPLHPRYAPAVLASSPASLLSVDVLRTPLRPEDLVMLSLDRWLAGGRDGLAALTPYELIGIGGDSPTGLAAFERVDEVAILAAPDAHLRPGPEPEFRPLPPCVIDPCLPCKPEKLAPKPPPDPIEQPPTFGEEDVFQIQSALVEQCERLRDRFAVLEPPLPPRGQLLQEAVAGARAWRRRFDTKFAALYFPWLLLRDPLQRGPLRALPPCGHVTGLYARIDLAAGVHQPPANGELRWVQSLTVAVEDALQGVLNPEGIDAIRAFPGRGIRVYGARTMSSDPAWRYVNVRRLFNMVVEAIDEGLQWAVFEPNSFQLRELLRLGISELLDGIWRRGALVGETPEEAYFVKCDDVNNPPALADLGQVVVDVGLAPAAPGEFIVVRVGRTRDDLQVSEVGTLDAPLVPVGRL